MARKKSPSSSSRSKGSSIGVELDGAKATVVTVVDGVVESVRSITANTGLEAMSRALSGYRMEDPVRVVLSSPSARSARIDITPAMSNRRAFTAESWRLMGSPEGYALSGIMADTDAILAGRMSTGLAVALPADQVSATYEALEMLGRRGEVVAVPATLVGQDGLNLIVRSRSVDVTAVNRGQPVGYQVLDVPGLDAMIMSLGGEESRDRVLAALGGKVTDPLASAEVARWLDSIVDGCTSAMASWKAAGINVPATITVMGPGAAAAGLLPSLRRRGLNPSSVSWSKVFTSGTSADRLAVLPAYLAAATCGQNLPAAAFVSASAVKEARKAAAFRRRRLVASTAATAILLAAAPILLPLGAAFVYEQGWSIWSNRVTGQLLDSATGAQILDAAAAAAVTDGLSSSSSFVSTIAARLVKDPPGGVQILQVEVPSSDPSTSLNNSSDLVPNTVVVRVFTSGDDTLPLIRWMERTASRYPEAVLTPVQFKNSTEGVELSVRFSPASPSDTVTTPASPSTSPSEAPSDSSSGAGQ